MDEAIVTLWDSGFDRFETGYEAVSSRELPGVRRSLGLASAKEELSVEYWIRASGLSREELADALYAVGVTLPPNVRRIPKNSLRRLRRMYAPLPASAPTPSTAEIVLPPLSWETIGQPSEPRCLSVDEILSIHAALEADFADSEDPIFPPGVKHPELLESAASRPHTGLGDTLKYPTTEMATAALFHSLIHNHPFHNGNKRTALVAMLAMLDENGRVVTANQNELFRFTLETAQHRLVPGPADDLPDREALECARWIRSKSRALELGERMLRWGRLRQVLKDFGCECAPAPGVGNRINISRVIQKRGLFGRAKAHRLQTQVHWAGDGTEAKRDTVHKIRRDLHLDDEHDVDSATFYRGAEVDEFIVEYRRILRRLAKL